MTIIDFLNKRAKQENVKGTLICCKNTWEGNMYKFKSRHLMTIYSILYVDISNFVNFGYKLVPLGISPDGTIRRKKFDQP